MSALERDHFVPCPYCGTPLYFETEYVRGGRKGHWLASVGYGADGQDCYCTLDAEWVQSVKLSLEALDDADEEACEAAGDEISGLESDDAYDHWRDSLLAE